MRYCLIIRNGPMDRWRSTPLMRPYSDSAKGGPWCMAPLSRAPAPGNDRYQHRMRPAETEDIVHQGSRIAVLPSAHGRGGVQTDRMCHRIAVLSATVPAGSSLLWSPLATPRASTAMNTQRSQAAAASRPLGSRSAGLANSSPSKRDGVELADSARSLAPTERPC
jgi:hypothetical protein